MNHRTWAGLVALAAVAFIGGCTRQESAPVAEKKVEPPKPAAVEIVKETERSRHFLAVTRQLELGGTLYGYVDIDGDALKFAGTLRGIVEQLAAGQPQLQPFAKQDYAQLFKTLGFDDVKALGLSSVPDATGYFRNRVFLYTPDQRHGLLAGLGGGPVPFARLNLAAANTDVYAESELDLAEMYSTIHQIVEQVAGQPASNKMEEELRKAGNEAAFSLLAMIQGWKGHSAMVLRLDPEKTMKLPAGPQVITIPAISLVLAVDGIAPAVEPALAKLPMLQVREDNGLKFYTLKQPPPMPGVNPEIVIDGSTLYLATTPEYFNECRKHPAGLADDAAFKAALQQVGDTGNGLVYVSPNFFKRLQAIDTLNPQLPAENKKMFKLILASMGTPDRPLVTVRTNLPDGILFRSYMNRSMKQDLAAVAVYNPVTIGMMAAMAIPAFQKVRDSSQEKAVRNNLRQLAAAADQYFLEKGVTTATYEDLVGQEKYIKALRSVAGEDYTRLTFKQGEPIEITLPSGKTVQIEP